MQSLFKFISRLQRKKEQFLLLSQSERDEIKKLINIAYLSHNIINKPKTNIQ